MTKSDFLSLDLDALLAVQAGCLENLLYELGAILRVNPQRIPAGVGEAGSGNRNLDMPGLLRRPLAVQESVRG